MNSLIIIAIIISGHFTSNKGVDELSHSVDELSHDVSTSCLKNGDELFCRRVVLFPFIGLSGHADKSTAELYQTTTWVLAAQKNHYITTVLLSTHKICFILRNKKINFQSARLLFAKAKLVIFIQNDGQLIFVPILQPIGQLASN